MFLEYLHERGEDSEFEKLSLPELACVLREFYASLCTKEGKHYSKSAYVNIRSALNRYLNSKLMRNKCIMNASIFRGMQNGCIKAQGSHM